MKFRFVQEYRETFRVGMMCKVLKVSRSGYYAWRSRQPSRRDCAVSARLGTADPGPSWPLTELEPDAPTPVETDASRPMSSGWSIHS